MKGMRAILWVLIISLLVAFLWDSLPLIKNLVHAVLDPSAGALLDWNLDLGFFILIFLFTLITTLLQKYLTDQATLKKIKEEQKLLQTEMKKYREHPEKLMQFQKRSMELIMESMPITMRPVMFTAVPFILFFRWFGDYFLLKEVEIFGFFSSWIWAYIITSILLSIILRKVFKVH